MEFENTMSTSTAGVYNTLRDPLVVEAVDLGSRQLS